MKKFKYVCLFAMSIAFLLQNPFSIMAGSGKRRANAIQYKFSSPLPQLDSNEMSQLTILTKSKPSILTYSAGAEIWKENHLQNNLIIRFRDRQFGAYITEGFASVDLAHSTSTTILSDVVYCLSKKEDPILIGVRRIPKNNSEDTDYYESTKELFVFKFEPMKTGTYIPISQGFWFPDSNILNEEEDAPAEIKEQIEIMKKSVQLQGKTIVYATDESLKSWAKMEIPQH